MSYKVIVIVGPTAVGKTDLSIELAQKFNAEIISGDSMQVYRGLDIGTAKATSSERQDVIHHLIDVREVSENFTVADFVHDAKEQIKKISSKGKLPIIVGGTGFYLQALLDGYQLGGSQISSNSKIREKWQEFAVKNGKEALWKKLNDIDRKAADKIPVNNSRRIIRALEVFESTGSKFSEQANQFDIKMDAMIIGLNTDRRVLYERINLRVDQMMEKGLLNEAVWLYQKGGLKLQAGRGIGYKELFGYIEKKESLANGVIEIKKNSRHYAKRQLTWFRNKMNVKWYDLIADDKAVEKIKMDVCSWIKGDKK